MATPLMQKKMLGYFVRLAVEEQKNVLQLVKTFVESRNGGFEPQTLERVQ